MNFLKLCFVFLTITVNIFAFKIEGITFNKSLENGYKEFVIHNDGTKKTRYKVSILPSGDEDITDCLEVSPKILTIEPKSTQVLKVFGTGKRKLEPKEYYFVLQFNQILIPTLVKGEDGKTAGNSVMGLAPSIEMKAYGGVIDFSKSLELTNVRFEKNKEGDLVFKGTLTNHAYGATDLGVNFYNRDRSILTSKGLGGIEGNSSRELEVLAKNFTSEGQIKYIEFYNENFETIKQVIRE